MIDLQSKATERVKRYHMTAERCANLSVWCAAMAGAEIIQRKAALGHGNGFEEWTRSLPFGRATCARYMKIAEALHDKLQALSEGERDALLPALRGEQDGTQKALALLNLPDPMDIFNPVHDRIAKIIHHVTSGATLTQLYFDWGIMPQPKLIEPLRGPAPELEPGDSLAHRAAVEVFDAAIAELWKHVRDMKTHLLLRLPELKRLSVELMDLRRAIDAQVSRG